MCFASGSGHRINQPAVDIKFSFPQLSSAQVISAATGLLLVVNKTEPKCRENNRSGATVVVVVVPSLTLHCTALDTAQHPSFAVFK